MRSSRLKTLLQNGELVAGLLLAVVFVALALLRPVLAPELQGKEKRNRDMILPEYYRPVPYPRSVRLPQPPSAEAILGTSKQHIDVFYTLEWGVSDAMRFGLTVALGAAALGTLIGLLSGFWGGWVNWLLMRVTDGFLTFPLVAAMMINALLYRFLLKTYDPGWTVWSGTGPLFPRLVDFFLSFEVLLILFTWMPYARLVNSLALRLRSTEFVEAARALGAGSWRIMLRHMLPNSLAPVIVLLSRDIGGVVLLEAGLSFAGLGGHSIWGELLALGKDFVYGVGGNPFIYWWVFVPPSLAIILFGVTWSLVGDGLNNIVSRHS